ncbi:unnamed protein product [Gordionus sp. m RMFG-2023]
MYNQWSLAYLDVQSGHLDYITQQNMNLPEENEENYLHLILYPMTDNVLSSNFFIEHKDGSRTIYPDPSENYQSYKVYYTDKFAGIIVEDKKEKMMHGTIEIGDESYLIRGRPFVRNRKNLYSLKQLSKTRNVLHNDHQDYIEIDNMTKANKSFKKAKNFSPLFNGPYYVEAMFYVDPLNMPMTNENLISAAIQVDYILRDPTFQREAHFILKGIKQYSGPDIRTEEDLAIFCQYTADARANKEEDVSYLISAYEGECLANADSYREATSLFVPQLNLHNVCRSWSLDLDLENSNCTDLKCTVIAGLNIDIPELLDFVPCNQLSNKLSSSQTGAICYKGTCILKKKLQEKAGSWSSWSSWSKCRGDNKIGYSKRTRNCNNPRPKFGGRYCQGAKIEYKICKNEFSRNDKNNQALCTKYDSSSIYTEFADEPCVLYCYVEHTDTYMNIGKAVDGTIARMDNSLDMCLNGAIIPIGCDNQLSSTEKIDKCGICKGDNSKCVPFEDEKKFSLTNELMEHSSSDTIKTGDSRKEMIN